MRPLTDFIPWVETHLLAVPRPLAERHLLDAARRFCRETFAVQRVTEPTDAQRGVAEYEPEVESGLEIIAVLNAWHDGTPLALPTNMTRTNPHAYHTAGAISNWAPPREAFVVEPPAIWLYPTPDKTIPGAVVFKLALAPARDASALPDELYDDWGPTIAMMAVASLAAIPGQAFTSMDMVMYGQSVYVQGVRSAKAEAYNGRARGNTRMRGRPFA